MQISRFYGKRVFHCSSFLKRPSIKGRPLIEVQVNLYRIGTEYFHAYLKNPRENGARIWSTSLLFKFFEASFDRGTSFDRYMG